MKKISIILLCFTLLFALAIPSFAATNEKGYQFSDFDIIPLVDNYYNDGYQYVMILKITDTQYVYYQMKSPIVNNNGKLQSELPFGIDYISFTGERLANGGYGWDVNFTEGTLIYGSSFGTSSQLYCSNFDVYNLVAGDREGIYMTADSNFPPAPLLAEIVEGVAMETLTEKMKSLSGTIQTLLLCGVGLMACLVVLKLFGKRSLISRH